MANKAVRVYWDACAWIAHILKEKPPNVKEDRALLCRIVLDAAERGRVEIATSSFSLVEVCKKGVQAIADDDQIAAFFENDFVLPVNLDRSVGELGRKLMNAGHPRLKPADAVHLASAIVSEAIELHTFDSDLLNLDGLIDRLDGGKLKICHPRIQSSPAPLLDC